MKILAIILLIISIGAGIAKDAALAVFFCILGVAFLILSGTDKKEEKAPAAKPAPRSAPKKTPKIQNHNHKSIQVPGAPAEDAYAYGGSQKDYFYYLLCRAFPAYAVQVDVSTGDLDHNSFGTMHTVSAFDPLATAEDDAVPVTFLLCKDGTPKLGILLGGRDDRNTPPYRHTEETLRSMGIPVQYYINTFRNKAGYVYSRVKEVLG